MSLIKHTSFQEVLFPQKKQEHSLAGDILSLTKTFKYQVDVNQALKDATYTVFDFETTGLNSQYDKIIEVGAQKICSGKVIGEFSSLIKVKETLSRVVQKITGINQRMLIDQPEIKEILPKFLEFIGGSILVAHNASFDIGFLKAEAKRLNIELEWSAFCTLKLARTFLANLESKSLDAISNHYGFVFESRHRAIGDVKVTVSFLQRILADQAHNLLTWKDMAPFEIK